MRKYTEELTKQIDKHIDTLENKVKKQISSRQHFDTNKGKYEIIEIEGASVKEMNIDGKIHDLFSSNGCQISGTVTVRASAYPPDTDKNGYISYCFKIYFNPVQVKFNFETEDFVIDAPIDIDYITLEDIRHC